MQSGGSIIRLKHLKNCSNFQEAAKTIDQHMLCTSKYCYICLKRPCACGVVLVVSFNQSLLHRRTYIHERVIVRAEGMHGEVMEADDSSSGSCKLHRHITIHTSTCTTNIMRYCSKYRYIHDHTLTITATFSSRVCTFHISSWNPCHIGGEKHIPSSFMACWLTIDLETISYSQAQVLSVTTSF